MKKYSMEEIEEGLFTGEFRSNESGIIVQLLTENTMLKKQLEVAVKALHKISKCEADTLQGCNVEAKEALEEIKRIGGV